MRKGPNMEQFDEVKDMVLDIKYRLGMMEIRDQLLEGVKKTMKGVEINNVRTQQAIKA